jgi:hypothetical protein
VYVVPLGDVKVQVISWFSGRFPELETRSA